MRKTIILLVLLSIFGWSNTQSQIVVNGDFTNDLSSWNVENFTSGSSTQIVSEAGNKVVLLHHNAGSDWNALGQEVRSKLSDGVEYRFECRYKVNGSTSVYMGQGFCLGFRFGDAQLIMHSNGLDATSYCYQGQFDNNWHDFSLNFVASGSHPQSNEPLLGIYFDYGGIGDIYLDDISITEAPPVSTTITVPDTIQNLLQSVEIPVITSALNALDNIISYQFDLAYDPDILQYFGNNLSGTIASGGTATVNSTTSGLLHVSYMSAVALSGSGPILNLQFNPLSLGVTPLTITNFLYNTDTVSDISNGSVSIIGLYGDVDTNTHVQAYDAALALQYSTGLDPLPVSDPAPWENWRLIVADVDDNDTVTANDASLILQYSAGLISTFPAEGSKSMENPVADVSIAQENNELVFISTGELYGLNIYSANGTSVIMGNPVILDQNMMSAQNISGSTYNLGLCTAYAPVNNTGFMRIPFDCNGDETLSFNMIINKNSTTKTIDVICPMVEINENIPPTANIFQDPASNQIEITGLQPGSVEIFDLQGQTVKTRTVSNSAVIDMTNLTNGVYFLKISTREDVIIKKILKY